MKVAVIHDVFIAFGGSERVLLALLDLFPEADVYVSLITPPNINILRTHTKGKIITSWFNHIPFLHRTSFLIKPVIYSYWESLNLTGYDLVVSSSNSFSSQSVITRGHTTHIAYVHSPPRYLYEEYNETQIIKMPFFRLLFAPLVNLLRIRDYRGAQRPDVIIANSKTVRKRINKYYGRDAIVLYPPVTLPERLKRKPRGYFLCVSRLVKQKGVDLAIRACNQLKEQLVIAGEGPEEAYLRSIAGPTITFLGWVPDEKISEVFAGAKALLFPSIEEDFGIVPVEAMGRGVPVIGHNSGGTAETIIDGKTGILFDEWSVDGVTQAMFIFSKKKFHTTDLVNQAKRFSRNRFMVSFMNLVSRYGVH